MSWGILPFFAWVLVHLIFVLPVLVVVVIVVVHLKPTQLP